VTTPIFQATALIRMDRAVQGISQSRSLRLLGAVAGTLLFWLFHVAFDHVNGDNRLFACERGLVEKVIHRLKVFRALKETYRRCHRFGWRVPLLASLYNSDLHAAKCLSPEV
jgi:hypothetical protein